MRRLILALALASLPAVIAAQNPAASNTAANDRLNLDLYWEFETVSDPQLSPDGKQIIYTRGWIDKVNDKCESSLWIMNADGSRNRFLVARQQRPLVADGDRIVYTAQGEPEGLADLRPLYGCRRLPSSQVTHVEKAPSDRDLVA